MQVTIVNPYAPAHSQAPPVQPTMADVWAAYPAQVGSITGAVAAQLQAHAPLAPTYVPGFEDEPRMRPRPYQDPVSWSLLKHAVQLALVYSVVMFATQGGGNPLLGLSYVGTSLLLMVVFVFADRFRFMDRDPAFDIVEVLPPTPAPAVQHAMRAAPLAPLVEQMHVAMPARVDVT